jgi:TatD DNase family protein
MFFDTHAHLNFATFVRDRENLARQCLKENVWLINVGTNYFTSEIAVNLAQKFEQGVYAAVGLHPINLGIEDSRKISEAEILKKESPFEKEFDYEKYKQLAQDKKVVAIGEIGLDYFYQPKTELKIKGFKLNQEILFLKQLKLAKELDLPLIIHCRKAHEDLLKIFVSQQDIYHEKYKGVIHCFTGNITQLKKYLELGFNIGFNGIIFKLNLKDVIKKTPLEKLLIETDCPYLSPSGKDRNTPLAVKEIAKEIANIKKRSVREIENQTTENAQKLFFQ